MKRTVLSPKLALAVLAILIATGPAQLCFADSIAEELSAQVTIRRDTYGVPHILAETEAAAAFGNGYAAAEDHVLDIARLYLQARGEEAAYFGKRFAEADFMSKTFKMHAIAVQGYEKSAPWMRFLLDAYAAGFNRYIDQHRAELPEWVKPITGPDIIAHGRRNLIMGFYMDLGQIGRIGRSKAAAAPAAPEDQMTPGSNMWAIGKERSATGNALLLGNPHLGWSGAMTWHELHITVPGESNVMGASLIGMPGVALGFNEYLGWSHTVNPNDGNDIYELTLDPSNPERYLYEGRSIPSRKETITIQVKTDAGMIAQSRDVYWTHYGPIVKIGDGKAYAFKSASLNEYRFLEQWHRLGKSRNLDEFRNILDMQAMPMFNIAYADVEGNCFYLFNGRFPDRPQGYDWGGVVPGNTRDTEWTHILPQNRLPSLLNPPGAYVQNCNSAPWYTNLNAILDRTQYPAELCPNGNSLRTQLSLEMIEADTAITLDELKRYKYNMKLLLADRIKGDLVNIARGRTVDGVPLDEAVGVLDRWDNTAARDSRGAILFTEFWKKYRRKADSVYAVPWTEVHPASTPHGIGDATAALEALAEAIGKVREDFGALDVAWGEIHRLRRGQVDVPIGGHSGEYGAFRVIGYRSMPDGKRVAGGGDSYVFAVEFSKPIQAYSILAYSQSEDPESPHHSDQSILFAREQWKPAWFSEEDIAKNTERSYHP